MRLKDIDLRPSWTPATRCPDGNPVIWNYFNQCAENEAQVVGFVCGIIAIIATILAHLCLIVIRIRLHTIPPYVSRSLTCTQTVIQVLSRSAECLGCIFAHQLGTQILLSIYQVGASLAFFLQWVYLQLARNNLWMVCASTEQRERAEKWKKSYKSQVYSYRRLIPMLALPFLFTLRSSFTSNEDVKFHSRHLLSVPKPEPEHHSLNESTMQRLQHFSEEYVAGYWLGAVAAVLQVLLIMPALYQAVKGYGWTVIQVVYFMLNILANSFYVASIYCQEVSTVLFLSSLPFAAPRLILIGFYFAILTQVYINGRQGKPRVPEDVMKMLSDSRKMGMNGDRKKGSDADSEPDEEEELLQKDNGSNNSIDEDGDLMQSDFEGSIVNEALAELSCDSDGAFSIQMYEDKMFEGRPAPVVAKKKDVTKTHGQSEALNWDFDDLDSVQLNDDEGDDIDMPQPSQIASGLEQIQSLIRNILDEHLPSDTKNVNTKFTKHPKASVSKYMVLFNQESMVTSSVEDLSKTDHPMYTNENSVYWFGKKNTKSEEASDTESTLGQELLG